MRDGRATLAATLSAVLCVATMFASTAPAATPIAASSLALLVGAVWRFRRLVVAHRRVVRRLRAQALPTVIDGVRVWLTPAAPGAVVAGVARPQIFLHPDLTGRLGPRPLAAVLRHEREHQRRRDPARLLLLATVEPALRWLPGGDRAAADVRARWEIRADRSAIQAGSTRPALAEALLAIAPPALPGAAAFGDASNLRLEALLDEDLAPGSRRPWLLLAVTAAWLTMCTAFWAVHGVTGAMASCPLGC